MTVYPLMQVLSVAVTCNLAYAEGASLLHPLPSARRLTLEGGYTYFRLGTCVLTFKAPLAQVLSVAVTCDLAYTEGASLLRSLPSTKTYARGESFMFFLFFVDNLYECIYCVETVAG